MQATAVSVSRFPAGGNRRAASATELRGDDLKRCRRRLLRGRPWDVA